MEKSIIGFIPKSRHIISLNNRLYIRLFHTSSVKAIKRIGPHNKDVISVIIGSLLGDGYVTKKMIEGCSFSFRQSSKHKDYLFWLYEFFYTRGYCSNLKPRFYKRIIVNYGKVYTGYEFNTFSFRSFGWIRKLFYPKGKKVIKKDIENYITPLSLAVWIMDDGGWTNYGVRLSANAFSYKEIIILTDILNRKFKLDTTIQKLSKSSPTIGRGTASPKKSSPLGDGTVRVRTVPSKNTKDKYSIYIKVNSMLLLRKIVQPYIQISLLYKIGI